MNVPVQKHGRPTEELNALFYNAFLSISNEILIVSAGMLHVEACQSLTCMELINQVDKLMYRAKENGKNRIMTINKEYRFFDRN